MNISFHWLKQFVQSGCEELQTFPTVALFIRAAALNEYKERTHAESRCVSKHFKDAFVPSQWLNELKNS